MTFAARIELPDGPGLPGYRARAYSPVLRPAVNDVHAGADVLDKLDPITTELVRLRCARTHDCRLCNSLRLASAYEEGAREPLLNQVDRYESSDLPEHQKVALRFTDAFITNPGGISRELRADLLHHFTREQVVELMLDIIGWSQQKVTVSLRIDDEADPERLTLLVLNDDITWRFEPFAETAGVER